MSIDKNTQMTIKPRVSEKSDPLYDAVKRPSTDNSCQIPNNVLRFQPTQMDWPDITQIVKSLANYLIIYVKCPKMYPFPAYTDGVTRGHTK